MQLYQLLFLFLGCHHVTAFAPRMFCAQTRRPSASAYCQMSADKTDADLWETLLDRFQGDFDNYQQVVQDRSEGMLPREGGGHENIHCTLVPVSHDARLAAFYFDGQPNAIFRFRYYHLIPQLIEDRAVSVDTVLYTLNPDLEKILRGAATDPLSWPGIFHDFKSDSPTILLPKCDIRWSCQMDPVQHAYATGFSQENKSSPGIHAVMVYGQALVESQMIPGQQILIKDQLSLWPNEFWIHDRGFDPETGNYIYGNQNEIPYRLERVTNIHGAKRNGASETLSWTLGPKYRTEEEYQEKLSAMGGPSVPRR
jgi:hypothetical protein